MAQGSILPDAGDCAHSRITAQAEADFRQHAVSEWPRECCGIIGEDGIYRPQRNVADDPEQDFRIDPRAMIHEPRFVLHSHTSKLKGPSYADMVGQAHWPRTTWGLVHCDGKNTGELVQWGPEAPIPPLLGRTYLWGIRDCCTALIHYFRLAHGVIFQDQPRQNFFWEPNKKHSDSLWEKFLPAAGFIRTKKPDVGDLMLIQVGRWLPSHCAIIVQQNTIYHHPWNALSRLDDHSRYIGQQHSYWTRRAS